MKDLAQALSVRRELAERLARQAGDVLMTYFGRLEAVEHKGAIDLVTIADREAEVLIRDAVSADFPDDAFLGEEEGQSGLGVSGWSWIVDPLDGTTNFFHRVPHFAVSIGIAHNGDLCAGVIYHPPLKELASAGRGQGAVRDGVPLRVTTRVALQECLLGTGFPYDRGKRAKALLAPLERSMGRCRGVRRMGAAALDLLAVAAGVYDGFWEPSLSPWDMAAGVVLIEEAGGTVTGYRGAPFSLEGGTLIASNGAIHDALVTMVGHE